MLVNFLFNFFILIIFSYLGFSILPLRNQNKSTNIFLFLTCFCLIHLTNHNALSMNRLMILILIYFIYFFIMFKAKSINILLILLPFILVIITLEFLVVKIPNVFFAIDRNISINSIIYLFAICITYLIILIAVFPYIKLSKFLIQKTLPSFTWTIFVLPLTTILFLHNLNESDLVMVKTHETLFISILGLFLSNFIMIFIFFKVILSVEYKEELALARNNEKHLAMKYKLIDDNYNRNFLFLHNLLHRCKQFKDSLDNEEYEEFRKEVNELNEMTFKEFNTLYTNSPIINLLIKEKYDLLLHHNISIKAVIKYNDFGFIDLNQQIILFSTIIDNAISSCIDVLESNRNIILKTREKGNQMILHTLYSSNEGEIIVKEAFHVLDRILIDNDGILSKSFDDKAKMMSLVIVFKDRNS